MNNDIAKNKINAALRLLEMIDKVNGIIIISQQMKSPLMLKQYKHLKKDYTLQLQELLIEFKLKAELSDAA